jgi:aspartyl-tRNA(Asn)/glutamyl-tRNA(Gln) amidotransferase subunit A
VIDLTQVTIRAAADLIVKRKLSAVELVSAVLDRIEETESLVHAYARVDAEGALAAARRADGERPRGPLHGIPFAVKDVLATADLPTECGCRALEGNRPARDATAVASLKAAGAILLGKHVTSELVCGVNEPVTRNAWNLAHYPGGSSAGGGVSVAVGSSLAALGTDAGGSVRKPASLNGVVGLKATHGLIPREGVLPPSGSLDHVGTFARTVEDTELLLAALAAPVDSEGPLEGMRLGTCRAYYHADVDSWVVDACEAALVELRRLGATIIDVEVPALALAVPAGVTIFIAEAGADMRCLLAERAAEIGGETRRALELGLLLPAVWVDAAQRARALLRREMAQTFRDARLDALVAPTLALTSMPLAQMSPDVHLARYMSLTMPANLTGQPSLSVPCGLSPEGLPIGLQIVGRPFDEATTLQIGRRFQEATDWHTRRPALPAVADLA